MKQDLQNPEPDLANQVVREDFGIARSDTAASPKLKPASVRGKIAVTLLTGGIDRPYTFGLVMELISKGAVLDVIGSEGVDFPQFHGTSGISFLNLQGSQRADVSLAKKVFRLAAYYAKVMHYAATAKPKIFHILWNNKFQLFDRTLLTFFYRLLGKKIVLTVHNVNAAKRDSKDTPLNRLTLRTQYRLADHIFVHTQSMKCDLLEEFGVPQARVTVIPFGINNAVPNTSLSRSEARQGLGIPADKKTILFFGRITPYKGLEYLIDAFQRIIHRDEFRLIVVGRPENDCQSYWSAIEDRTLEDVRLGRILLKAEHIPDDETEIYFKAADVLVLPYRRIYQSGVLFLGYSFGLPILAADVGDLKDEVVEGETGFVFKPEDPVALAKTIERYFSSDLFLDLNNRRQKISDYAKERHSWSVVGQMTMTLYASLLRSPFPTGMPKREVSETSVDTKMPY
jgi:D-inositol-3-phosphate glycosyltransferase